MADANRLAAALRYIDEQQPADPLARLKTDPIGALRSAFQNKVEPIINNARRTFATGGGIGDILRAYGEAGAPANAAMLRGMGTPYQEPTLVNAPPSMAPNTSYGNLGDASAQMAGGMIGDPLNAIPLAGPAARGAVAAGKAAAPAGRYAGEQLARGLEKHMVRSGGILPMDTWHGSPHRFPPTKNNPLGEFDPMKIGTGEGAQAYGAGAAYLAENPGVAKGYQKDLANFEQPFIQSGKTKVAGQDMSNLDLEVFKYLETGKKDAGQFPHNTLYYAKQAAINKPEVLEKLKTLGDNVKFGHEINRGSLYKVDLPDEHIAKMLDWDKPLSEQTPYVQKIINEEIKRIGGSASTGERAYKELMFDARMQGNKNASSAMRSNEEAIAASNRLRELGIPGIRYLDQGSRTAGEGTSNFVVFDPKHMNIIGRE